MDSQSLVRALKASADPPTADGPTKIEIAFQAWNDASLYVPRKGEVIADWLLNKLLKEKDNASGDTSCLDSRYWELLSRIVASKESSSQTTSWLVPLVHRIPIAPIVVQVFSRIESDSKNAEESLAIHFRNTMAVLWPLAVRRMNAEVLLECFGAALSTTFMQSPSSAMRDVSKWIVSSFRASLGSTSAKRKIYVSFLDHHLSRWLECVQRQGDDDELVKGSFDTGSEILFNLDVLRQANYVEIQGKLFAALRKSLPSPLVLPEIFTAYVHAIKRHRGTLFSQGSSQGATDSYAGLRQNALRFFQNCNDLLTPSQDSESESTSWRTRIALLNVLDQENLYSVFEGRDILSAIKALCIKVLASTKGPNTNNAYVVDALARILRLDPDLIVDSLPAILSQVLIVHDCHESVSTLVDLLCDHFSKTRTVNVMVSVVLAVLQQAGSETDADSAYASARASALLHKRQLERIGKAICHFLTPSQTLDTLNEVTSAIKAAWKRLSFGLDQGSDEEKPKKKPKLDSGSQAPPTLGAATVPLALLCHFACTVLTSIPLHSCSADMQRQGLELLTGFRSRVVQKALLKVTKVIRKSTPVTPQESWALQISTANLLRLQYCLYRVVSLPADQTGDEKLAQRLMEFAGVKGLSPEFNLEIFRTLLEYMATGVVTESQGIIDNMLDYLQSSWLSDNREEASHALSFMSILFQRWLPLLDIVASHEQLKKLFTILYRTPFQMRESKDALVSQILSSAQFWEMSQIRHAFLAYATDATADVDHINERTIMPDFHRRDTGDVFTSLMATPDECFPRATKAIMAKRAIAFDIAMFNPLHNDKKQKNIMRVFLTRILPCLGTNDLSIEEVHSYFNQLLVSRQLNERDLESITLDVIDAITSFLLRSKDSAAILASHLQELSRFTLGSRKTLKIKTVFRTVDSITSNYSVDHLSKDIVSALSHLHNGLMAALVPHLERFDDLPDNVLECWLRVLVLGRWLGVRGQTPRVGRRLCSMEKEKLRKSASVVYHILLEEFSKQGQESSVEDVQVLAASFVLLYRSSEHTERDELDRVISRLSPTLSVVNYSGMLEFITSSLSGQKLASTDKAASVHLFSLLIQDPPMNTLQIVQTFSTRLTNALCSPSLQLATEVDFRAEALQFLARRCSERPATLRLVDMGSIWTVLSVLLAGSSDHEDHTTPTVFREITAILSALLRLRRDLILYTLPHLGMILRRLVFLLRQCRPNLGWKQSKEVADTFPHWMSIKEPLFIEHAKSIARLLETLTMKTVVRVHSSSKEAQKAESLAKPFSKHAAYVLTAYIEALNDPLCVFPSEMKRELRPGLFALCGMLKEHTRDALMVSSLDSGGKAVMKSLWQEFEKQQYVGKG